MHIRNILAVAALVLAAAGITSCTEKKCRVEGTVTGAQDSTLYF